MILCMPFRGYIKRQNKKGRSFLYWKNSYLFYLLSLYRNLLLSFLFFLHVQILVVLVVEFVLEERQFL